MGRYEIPPELAKWATENPDLSVTLRLEFPLKDGSAAEITEIRLKRPKGKHMRAISDQRTAGQALDLIGSLAALETRLVDELDANDFERASGVIEVFRGAGQGSPQPGAST